MDSETQQGDSLTSTVLTLLVVRCGKAFGKSKLNPSVSLPVAADCYWKYYFFNSNNFNIFFSFDDYTGCV
jgi:hypothetical protein